MGLKIKLSVVIFTTLLFSKIAFAGWTGPSDVLSGTWGNNPGQFAIQYGDTSDTFPTTIDISPSGRIAITEDQTLDRVQIFNSTGQLANIINTFAFTIAFDANENLYVNVSGGGFRKYDSSGGVVWSKTGTSYDALYALSSGDIIGYDKDSKSYSWFSSTGQFIKTSASMPAELGVVKTESRGSGNYRITITYPDKTYILTSDSYFTKYVRDKNGNVYALNSGGVWRFSQCGKEIAELTMPQEEKETITAKNAPDQSIALDVEYGEPVVAPNGDVYTWKKTLSKYIIVKWTWQDDSTVPSGPDAPSGLTVTPSTTGLYLAWTASAQDPGCVTAYEIARATTSGGVLSTVGTVDKGVQKYNDTTAEAGTMYYYKVRAKAGKTHSVYTKETPRKR